MEPKLDFTLLYTFYWVARLQSFSQAAEALHLSQPAVSRQVQALERQVGDRLLQRKGKRGELTATGEALFRYACDLYRLAREASAAMDEFRNLDAGRVTLAAGTTPGRYLLPPRMAAFRKRHPHIQLQLTITNSQHVEELLLMGEVDLGVTGGPVQSPLLSAQPFVQDTIQLVIGRGHPLAAACTRAELSVEAFCQLLQDEILLTREAGSSTQAAVAGALQRLGLTCRESLTLSDPEAIKGMLLAGVGFAFLSQATIAAELEAGRLVTAPYAELQLTRQLWLARSRHSHPPRAVTAFARFLMPSQTLARA